MKKAYFFAGLAAAALCLVGCNKEADLAGNGTPVQIVLSDASTRTVNEGMDTKWEENDPLSVFTAPAGTQTWSSNLQFKVTDATANTATGEVILEEGAYDWYIFYPYTKQLPNPTTHNPDGSTYAQSGYTTVGGASQTQAGNDSKAHLAGTNLPIYGVAKNVDASDTPVVTMKHVASVLAVNVTNDSDKPLTVTSITFQAPEDIVGTYYIDISGTAPELTDSGDRYVYDTVTLSVTGGTAIAPGASAKFYIAVKPFTAASGKELKLTILSDQGEVEKTVTLAHEYTFASGSIKTLNVGFEAPAVVETMTVADINAAITSTDQSNLSTFTGKIDGLVVSYVNGNTAFIQDGTAGILLYKSGHGLTAGDVLSGTVSGKGWVRYGVKQLTDLSGFTKVAGTAPAPVVLTIEQLLANYDRYVSVRVQLNDVEVTDAITKTDRNGVITEASGKTLNLYAQVTNKLEVPVGVYEMVGYPSYHNEDKQLGLWSMDDITLSQNIPTLSAEAAETEVEATATSVVITISGNVDWTADVEEGEATLSKTSGTGDDTITVSFAANEDTENEKTYLVVVRTDDPTLVASGDDELPITITQAKADASGEKTVTVDFSKQSYANAYVMPSPTTINGITFNFDKGTNTNNPPKYYNSGTAVRMYGSNSMTVSAPGTIISIELGFGSDDGTNAITTDVPTYAEPKWEGEASSVTFTIGGTTGQRRIKTVTVQYKDGGAPAAATLTKIEVSGATTTYNVGDTFSFDGTVTATYSDGTTKTVTPTSVSSPDMTVAGTQEVTVTYTEGGVTKTANYTITVNAVTEGTTVSMTMADYVAANDCSVSVSGAVTMYKVLQLSPSVRMSTTGDDNCGSFWGDNREWRLYQNKNGNVIVSVADGCELKSVKLTFGVSNNGALFDASNQKVTSGTAMTVSGSSVTYTVGNTNETGTNGQVKITAVEVVYTGEGTFPDTPVTPTEIETKITMANNTNVYVGETVALNATSNVEGAPITYESEDTSIATVDANGVVTGVAEGTVKVYARIAAVEGQYTAAERYCNVTVSIKPVETEGTVLFDQTYLAANKNGTKGVISYTNDSDYGTVTPTELRVYKGKQFVVSASGDHKITGIKMTCTKNGATKEGPGCWGKGAPEGYTFTSDSPVGTWSGSASSVSFTATDNQVRIIELVVTYE